LNIIIISNYEKVGKNIVHGSCLRKPTSNSVEIVVDGVDKYELTWKYMVEKCRNEKKY